jgi:hypothetical protein
MKGIARLKRVVILSLIGVVVLVPLLLFLFRGKAVSFAMPLSACLRPKSYLFLNPFRDRAPENLGEEYLTQMKNGSPETVLSKIKFDSERERMTISKIEKEQAPRKWLLQSRKDQSQTSTLIYAVSRSADELQDCGNVDVTFRFEKRPDGWALISYSAIY